MDKEETTVTQDVNSEIKDSLTQKLNSLEKMIGQLAEAFQAQQMKQNIVEQPQQSSDGDGYKIVGYPENKPKQFDKDQLINFIDETYTKVEDQRISYRDETQLPLNGWETLIYGLKSGGLSAEQIAEILPIK